MTQELIKAEFGTIRAISKGMQVAAATQDEWGQWHTFADEKSVMPTLDDLKGGSISKPEAHTFKSLLKWVEGNPHATHIVAFTNVPDEQPLILLKVRD